MSDKPYLIQFKSIGQSDIGYISIAENETLPFVPRRIYWTYFTPEDVKRGFHSHYNLEQVLVAVAGRIVVTTELSDGKKQEFILDNPRTGLFVPKMCWRVMQYSHNAVQMCIASDVFDEKDYIRDYNEFLKL